MIQVCWSLTGSKYMLILDSGYWQELKVRLFFFSSSFYKNWAAAGKHLHLNMFSFSQPITSAQSLPSGRRTFGLVYTSKNWHSDDNWDTLSQSESSILPSYPHLPLSSSFSNACNNELLHPSFVDWMIYTESTLISILVCQVNLSICTI